MGIKDLLRFMKPFINPIHIKKYGGKRVGIDAYSWLHKGAYSCSMELYLNPGGDAASRYLQYFMHRVNLLKHYRITPVVVFDGGNMPCKSGTEDERRRKKNANVALAKEKLAQGNTSAAIEFFQRAVCITPYMAYELMQILKLENIEFVVAPYEADAQLAYLATLNEEQGGISAVITEDSDLMAYGCQANIFKMDKYGNGEEILLDKVFNSVLDGLSFRGFDQELFIGMCVLAGCDFLPSVPGIGIKKAYTFVSKYRNLDRILSVMKYEKGNLMPQDYTSSFKEALAVFQYARIYDVDDKILKPMKPVPLELQQSLEGNLDFLGPELPPSVATAIAQGRVNPITMEAYDCYFKDECHYNHLGVDASDKLPRTCTQLAPMQQSCFTIFSANGTEKETIAVTEPKPTVDNCMFLNEAIALEKLLSPQEHVCKSEITEVERIKFPNNNPFNKNKQKHGYSDLNSSPVEQDSVAVDVAEEIKQTVDSQECFYSESSDCLSGAGSQMLPIQQSCSTLSQDSGTVEMTIRDRELQLNVGDRNHSNEDGKEITPPRCCHKLEATGEVTDFPSNRPLNKRKQNDNILDMDASAVEQVSVVIDVDDPDIRFMTSPESQESVKSKPIKRAKPSTMKKEKQQKSLNKSKSAECEKMGIFKFFKRLES